MDNIIKHNHKMTKAEIIEALEDLANSGDRHETYHKFRDLSNKDWAHMKDSCKEELHGEGHYHHYPHIVLFHPEDEHIIKMIADPSVTQYHISELLEKDNHAGGISWNSVKKVARKAAKVYRVINNVVHTGADLASQLPINNPKYQAVVTALKTGTELQDKILDKIEK